MQSLSLALQPNARTTNRHLRGDGERNEAQRRTKREFLKNHDTSV